MSHRPQCVECGMASPPTNTNYTLISGTGWRLIRGQDQHGVTMEWRCPGCWAKRKSHSERAGPQSDTPPAAPQLRKRHS
jgi:hypothetical protein